MLCAILRRINYVLLCLLLSEMLDYVEFDYELSTYASITTLPVHKFLLRKYYNVTSSQVLTTQ